MKEGITSPRLRQGVTLNSVCSAGNVIEAPLHTVRREEPCIHWSEMRGAFRGGVCIRWLPRASRRTGDTRPATESSRRTVHTQTQKPQQGGGVLFGKFFVGLDFFSGGVRGAGGGGGGRVGGWGVVVEGGGADKRKD